MFSTCLSVCVCVPGRGIVRRLAIIFCSDACYVTRTLCVEKSIHLCIMQAYMCACV